MPKFASPELAAAALKDAHNKAQAALDSAMDAIFDLGPIYDDLLEHAPKPVSPHIIGDEKDPGAYSALSSLEISSLKARAVQRNGAIASALSDLVDDHKADQERLRQFKLEI